MIWLLTILGVIIVVCAQLCALYFIARKKSKLYHGLSLSYNYLILSSFKMIKVKGYTPSTTFSNVNPNNIDNFSTEFERIVL